MKMNRIIAISVLFLFATVLFSAMVTVGINEDKRTERRAFYTAPPVIPHEVEDQNGGDCLDCHIEVMEIDEGEFSSMTPHPQFSRCLQCHAAGTPMFGAATPSVANSFKGLEEPRKGDRPHDLTPPTIPHRLFLRENCNSCHGADQPNPEMRGPHPERSSCLQCHVHDKNKLF